MKGDAAEELQQKFAQVVRPLETRKCEKTMSGDHMMVKKHHTEPIFNELGYITGYTEFDYKVCLACGIINDLDKEV